ncbi:MULTISPECIES: hypothetical protein [unclassified Acinetobacter]|uniref:hypothetical protein n=1 Tax=unclassified Acinetobacter TaxID=196816 RepID=UPI002934B669|nr:MULTISPECIES: hypothetical protein [unclassified Acinetobacter]WOE32748.1 hypothetical protein QSG84_06110 [Acinetobacter sp. SAAs470]WOE38225.1 hypothetical protein QSG86_15165 [Acinetobacter sp. SAAs474]
MKIEIKKREVAEYAQRWFDFEDGAKLLIADKGRPAFNRALELNGMQAERELRGFQPITDESALASNLAFNRAVAYLILDWEGIEKDGQPFEYNHQNAELLCTSTEQSLDLINFCLSKAYLLHDEKNKTVADEVGKSSNTTNSEVSDGHQKKPKKFTKNLE